MTIRNVYDILLLSEGTERTVIDMRKVNLEVIRKELYSNLQEMFFGAFYDMSELDSTYYDKCETNTFRIKQLSNCLEIKRSKPFSNYEYTFYITVENDGVHCHRANGDDKCFDWIWGVYFSDTKNKTLLFMVVAKKLTIILC